MHISKKLRLFITLLLCGVMTFSTPLAVLADAPSSEEGGSGSESSDSSGGSESSDSSDNSGGSDSSWGSESSASSETSGSGSSYDDGASIAATDGNTGSDGAVTTDGVEGAAADTTNNDKTAPDGTSTDLSLQADALNIITSQGDGQANVLSVGGAAPTAAATTDADETSVLPVTTGGDDSQTASSYGSYAYVVDGKTIYINGISESTASAIAEEVAAAIRQNAEHNITNSALIDAEKFNNTTINNYDNSLCWAGTAANMLWTKGYAQNAINPQTNAYFKSVDEVFDYFRNCFTDDAGVPSAGIYYFMNGTYEYQGTKDVAQVKNDAYKGNLLPNQEYHIEMIDAENGKDIFSSLGNLADMAVGAWIRWWDTVNNKFEGSAHWLSVVGLAKDDSISDYTKKYLGIFLADPDSNPPGNNLDPLPARSEWADKAADAPNIYTYYPIKLYATSDGKEYWRIVGYENNNGDSFGLLCSLLLLLDGNIYESNGDSGSRRSSSSDSDTNNVPFTQDAIGIVDGKVAINKEAVMDILRSTQGAEALKNLMIENNMVVFAPFGNEYDQANGGGFDLILRKLHRALMNVYIDGVRVPDNGSFTIEVLPCGIFRLVLNKEYLSSLAKDTHTLKLEFDGSDDVEIQIVVK